MDNQDQNKLQKYLSYFNRDAVVFHNEQEFFPKEEDFESLTSKSNYWHSKTDPSSWLTTSTVDYYHRKYESELPRSEIINLSAQVLNVTPEKIESTLNWNANYMAFHDGGTPDEHHVYPPEEEEVDDPDSPISNSDESS